MMFGRIWDWLKAHLVEVVAGSVGVIVAAYLIWQGQNSSSGTGAQIIAQPATGSGTGGGGTSTTGSTTTTTGSLPYNPDFSVLNNITDKVLSGLYSQEYNLETQINAATVSGNTSLVASLTNSLTAIQNQIAGYTPAPTNANVQAPTLNTSFGQDLINAYLGAQQTLGSAFNADNFWTNYLGSLGIGSAQAAYVEQQSNAYTQATGLRSTTEQLQNWLNQAYQNIPIIGSTTTTTPPAIIPSLTGVTQLPVPAIPPVSSSTDTSTGGLSTVALPSVGQPLLSVPTSLTGTVGTSLPVLNTSIASNLITGR
jgi:hypothetical protein